MDPEISQQLLQLNDQFYQTFAVQFSATRQRLQPGVLRIIESLPNPARILDLGCGNGELARQLAEREQRGTYVGLDKSIELLKIAQLSSVSGAVSNFEIIFHQADLSASGWDAILGEMTFDIICAFAVFHHIPGHSLRQSIITQLATRLAPDGIFIHSEWQFLKSPRLHSRIQSWAKVGLLDTQVDPGDYLLDWRGGGSGFRYVHHFSSAELNQLAKESGFQVLTEFNSDGEGSRLGLYQTWQLRDRWLDSSS